MTTLIFDDRTTELEDAEARDASLWVPLERLEAATGWRLEPQGLCRGPVCLPLSAEEREAWVQDGRFDVAAFARRRGQPVLRDEKHDVWSVGPPPEPRLAAGRAPDFSLPDLDGRTHALSDYRGQKVLLLAWASW